MKIYIGKSKLHGKGLFANQNIKKGEIIAIIKGKVVNWIVINKSTSAVGPNWIGLRKNHWINPNHTFEKLNHSCNPSSGIRGSRTLVAIRNIKNEEEVTIDYSITEEDLFWRLNSKCKCGSKKCRKIIRSIQFLPLKTYKSYLPYVPNYFQKVYLRYHNIKSKKHG